MSISREKADEICKHIKENSGALFGQKFWECRLACALLAQQKGDRWEPRFMAIAKFRVFILHGKSVNSVKIEKSFNIVALRFLELMQQQQPDKQQQLQFGWEERNVKPSLSSIAAAPPMLHVLVRLPDNNNNNNKDEDNAAEKSGDQQQQQIRTVRELAMALLVTLKHYFPDIQRSLAKHFLNISPSLLSDFPALPCSTPELPCRNFRRSYVAHCDWLEQPFRDEVIWDIERIYFVHAQHELDLNDFNHLPTKDLQALIGAVQFSDFFTGISATALRLQPEHVDALLTLVRRSHSLRSLRLCRCAVPKDWLAQLAAALALNPTLPLERLRLGELSIEDRKGLVQLGTLLPQLPALHTLFLTDCALSEKLALSLLQALHHGIELAAADSARTEATERRGSGNGCATKQQRLSSSSSSAAATDANTAQRIFQLRALNLSGNLLGNGAELAQQLANLVALSDGTIRLLDLGGTAVQLDRLWSALKLGALGLEVLRLGGCYCSSQSSSSKRSAAGAKDSAQVARELFTAVHSLKELNLSGTHIGSALLDGILSGLAANPHLPAGSLHLCLDSAIVGSAASVSVLEQHHIDGCACVGSLSLRDNALEHEAFRLLSALGGRTSSLRVLDIGGANFMALKAAKKHAPVLAGILSELVKLVNGVEDQEGEGPFIEELSLADARLGPHLSIFLNALGLCGRLKRLDLSNNELGPAGARLLCKSLQLNHALRWLALDRNQIGQDGFGELARALRMNTTLDGLQMPFVDAAECVVAMARMPGDRARFQLQMEEIEQYLERNRQLRTLPSSTTTDHLLSSSVGHLVQRTMHRLNNYCELYGLDASGQDAELKKTAFHKLGKLITTAAAQQQQVAGCGTIGAVGDCGTITSYHNDDHDGGGTSGAGDSENDGKSLKTVADQLAERIEHVVVDVATERFVQQFVCRLADQEGVQLNAQPRKAEIDQQTSATNKRLGVALRDDLTTLLDKYQKEFAWCHLFATVHQCLLAEDAQEMFQQQQGEKPSPSSGATSLLSSSCSAARKRKELMFRNNGGGGATTKSHHRPESALVQSADDDARLTAADAMAQVLLMSRSVVGDFAHATAPDDDAAMEQQKCHNDNNLIHLAKQRPKPARLINRSRIQPTTANMATTMCQAGQQQQQQRANSTSTTKMANGHIIAPSPTADLIFSDATQAEHASSSSASSSSTSADSANPPISSHYDWSPQPLRVHAMPASPPVVPPRREKTMPPAGGPSSPLTPPKLPPKPPPSSPSSSISGKDKPLISVRRGDQDGAEQSGAEDTQ